MAKSPHPSRIFKTPDDLIQAWTDYKESLKGESKKWEKVQYVGKDGYRQTDYPKIPLTLEGFKVYCYDNHGNVGQYFKNQDDNFTEFIPICSRIRNEIRADQIAGGLLGFYNPSITQRLNNLKEQTDNTTNHNVNLLNIDPLSDTANNSPAEDSKPKKED